MDESFVFKLDCPPDEVTPEMLMQVTKTFAALLDDANASQWHVSGLELHSIQIVARPKTADNAAEESIKKLSDIASLSHEDVPIVTSADEQPKSVTQLFNLIKVFGSPVVIVVGGETNTFTPQTVSRIEQAMQKHEKRELITFGKVQGTVDKLILQNSHRNIGLVDDATNTRVDIKFVKELDEQVKQINVGSTIRVTGMLSQERTSMQAETINIVNQGGNQQSATVADLEGILDLDFTGGLSSVEFVSTMRDTATTGGMA